MVDKLWFDWQHAHESNYYAFFGGTVSEFNDTALFAEYPNGGPPFLNVRSLHCRRNSKPDCSDTVYLADTQRWTVVEQLDHLGCYGHY